MLSKAKSACGGNNFITAGELAKLAGTTKRTILWYATQGVLKPVKISSKNYRYYTESQVLDYQMILLLTTLGVSLREIRSRHNLPLLFAEKKKEIKAQINTLKFNLTSLEKITTNFNLNKTFINPIIKILKPFDIFYIEKIGPYVKIGEYCHQLASMFTHKGRHFTPLAIFTNPTYQPKKSLIKVGVLAWPDMIVNPKYQHLVKKMTFAPGKVITHTHQGVGNLLSLFWKELEKYCRLNDITIRHDIPDFEIYRKVSSDPRHQFFEIYLPIK